MKKILLAFAILITFSTSSTARNTPQEFCDNLAGNMINMLTDYNDLFKKGRLTYEQIFSQHVYSQPSAELQMISNENLQQIFKVDGQVSVQDIRNYVFSRCERDYRNLYISDNY